MENLFGITLRIGCIESSTKKRDKEQGMSDFLYKILLPNMHF